MAVGTFKFSYDGLAIRDIQWQDDDQGPVMIYKFPEPGRPYVLGGDTAGEGSDSFVDQVLDNVTGLQVAKLRSGYKDGMDEGTYAHLTYCLGMYYNTALMAIETNYSTYPQKELERLGYRKFWVREKVDEFTGDIVQSYGFQTNKLTRAVVLGNLQSIVREQVQVIVDKETLEEMLAFTLNEDRKLRPEAEAGSHDDCVLALAIAHNARGQQRMTVDIQASQEKQKWTRDMWEDYNRASKAEKEMMLREWGRPE